MLTRILVAICSVSPFWRRQLWRWWYGKLARTISSDEWTFMNYGFHSPESARLALQPADEPDRLCIQLYDRVIAGKPLAGKMVLEVGSGRGGGASYITRQYGPARMVGIDYSPQAVAFCQKRHVGVAGLEFRQGDAEKLPFEKAAFDAVVNVESSHCYGNVPQFFNEVARVLRSGGYFHFADLRTPEDMAILEAHLLAQRGWTQVEREDITAAVSAALLHDDDRKRGMIQKLVPKELRGLFEEFAGLAGGKVSRSLQQRELLYYRFVLQKA